MCSALQVVLFLAVTSVSRTVAEIPCTSDISEKLKACYEGGTAPNQKSGGNGTYIYAPKSAIPKGSECGIGWQDDSHTHSVFFDAKNKVLREDSWNADFKTNYIEESKAGSKIKYRLFVIYNANGAYAYYRCESGDGKGNGIPVGVVAVGCGYTEDPNTEKVVNKALECFKKLNISVEKLKPCTTC